MASGASLRAAGALASVRELGGLGFLRSGLPGLLSSSSSNWDPVPGVLLPSPGVVPGRGGLPGTMELGVPKSKITRSRKGKRNGPKFLKPTPVISRCVMCGRVKLPHFFCCDGAPKVEPASK